MVYEQVKKSIVELKNQLIDSKEKLEKVKIAKGQISKKTENKIRSRKEKLETAKNKIISPE